MIKTNVKILSLQMEYKSDNLMPKIYTKSI